MDSELATPPVLQAMHVVAAGGDHALVVRWIIAGTCSLGSDTRKTISMPSLCAPFGLSRPIQGHRGSAEAADGSSAPLRIKGREETASPMPGNDGVRRPGPGLAQGAPRLPLAHRLYKVYIPAATDTLETLDRAARAAAASPEQQV